MPPAPRPITVLLAEDDPDDRLLVHRALLPSGIPYEVYDVQDGEELLDFLHQRAPFTPEAAPRPDLILLDLNMPRKDGRDVLREIKAAPAFRQIPVVVLSTSESITDVEETYTLGVNAFITKPFSYAELAHVLGALGDFWFRLVKLPPNASSPGP